jgi:flagellin
LNITAVSLSTATSAQTALSTLDTAIAAVNTDRARFGATINRLTFAADNLANISTNAQESRSRILDTDYAQTTTELARTQIIQQAATAMLAQANQAPQSVLSLLR